MSYFLKMASSGANYVQSELLPLFSRVARETQGRGCQAKEEKNFPWARNQELTPTSFSPFPLPVIIAVLSAVQKKSGKELLVLKTRAFACSRGKGKE